MRCEPATEIELLRIERARATGKVKAPTWYRPAKMPAPIKYDLKQAYPAEVRALFTRQSDTWLDGFSKQDVRDAKLAKITDPIEYVREFERLKGLRPCATAWVTPDFHAA